MFNKSKQMFGRFTQNVNKMVELRTEGGENHSLKEERLYFISF